MSASLQKTNGAIVRRILQAISSNDIRPLVEALDDHVVWRSNTLPAYFRFGGEHLNRGGVMDLLAKLASEYSFVSFDLDKLAETDNEVWAICDAAVHHMPSDRMATLRIAFRMVFTGGKITAYEDFFDTANVLLQLGLLPDIPG